MGDSGSSRVSLAAAGLTLAIGVAVLAGWVLDLAALKSVVPGLISMKANTALCFILTGVAIGLLRRRAPGLRSAVAARACMGAVVVVAGLSLFQSMSGLDVGIDQALFRDVLPPGHTEPPGRLAPSTSVGFLLLGASLLLSGRRTGKWPAVGQGLAALSGLAALLGLIAYLYNTQGPYTFALWIPMALHTTVAFLTATAGVLALTTDRGWMAVLVSDRAGGVIARRLLPVAALLSILLGWLHLKGEEMGLYGQGLGASILVTAIIASLGALIVWTAAGLNRAEAAHAESERRYREILASALDGFVRADPEGRFLDVNESYCRMIGYSRDELLSMRIPEIEAVESSVETAKHIGRVIQEGSDRFETRHRRKDGTVIDVAVTVTALDGRGGGLAAFIRDTTEAKRAETTLRTAHGEQKLIGDLLQLSLEGDPLDRKMEKALDLVLGLPEPGLTGKGTIFLTEGETLVMKAHRGLTEAVRSDCARVELGSCLCGSAVASGRLTFCDRVDDRHRACREETPSHGHYCMPMRSGDRTLGLLNLYVEHGRGREDRIERLLVSVADVLSGIVERARAEEGRNRVQGQLMQAQKMESVGRLAGGVAHDFNNMLTVILGRGDRALARVGPDQPIHADLEEILKAARRSAELTRQLLAFARKQTVVPRVLDLNDTVGGMLQMLRRLIGEDIRLDWRPGQDLWPVRIDPSQVDQVLANLCINARDAITGTGRIAIETGNVVVDAAWCSDRPGFVPGTYVQLVVSDDGHGMDKPILEHIFEPFFTTKEVGKGTGLGLATVYGIVKQNGGFIHVNSEPGKGATFKIYLPEVDGTSGKPRGESPAAAPKGRGETVLLVEDEPAILGLARMMADSLGYATLTAGSPDEALRQASAHPGAIHALVTDMVMPGMNGLELAGRLKALRPDLKCIFMSGYTADGIARHGVLEEGTHFLQKPFTLNDLAVRLREALGA